MINENTVNNNKITNETETTAVASVQSSDITSLFSSLDVNKLNAAVTDIANTPNALTEDEKKHATQIINDWNNGIVKCIKNEHDRLNAFLRCIQNVPENYTELVSPGLADAFQRIISIAGLDDEALKIGCAIQEYNDAVNAYKTVKSSSFDIDETIATDFEKIDAQAAHNKAVIAARNKKNAARRAMSISLSEFNKTLNANPNVKSTIAHLTAFGRTLTKSITICTNKANAAKMAVVINDREMREKLCALINISIK